MVVTLDGRNKNKMGQGERCHLEGLILILIGLPTVRILNSMLSWAHYLNFFLRFFFFKEDFCPKLKYQISKSKKLIMLGFKRNTKIKSILK